ncbi:MAG: hypothetical protein ACRCV0_03295, partial [Brevinema sp.]
SIIFLFFSPLYGQSTAQDSTSPSYSINLDTLYSIMSNVGNEFEHIEVMNELKNSYTKQIKIVDNTIVQNFKQKEPIYRDEAKAYFNFDFDVIYHIEESNTIIRTVSGVLEKIQDPDLAIVSAIEQGDLYPPLYLLWMGAYMLGHLTKQGIIGDNDLEGILMHLPSSIVSSFPDANLPHYIDQTITKISPFKWKFKSEEKMHLKQ